MLTFLACFGVTILQTAIAANKPHVIFIFVDDLGWNDVSFHGSNQIPTPNIDALAYSGVILHNYYVTPLCTPSRSALLTGKYPIRTGLQHGVIFGPRPYGLPLEERILPQYMKDIGYTTRIVGKWHLGYFKKEYTPTYRGFDSHYGYWCSHEDYYDHTAFQGEPYWGYDFRRDMDVERDAYGKYATDLFTDEAVHLINEHNASQPLFLYMSHLAVHVGNYYEPLQAPSEAVDLFGNIENKKRRIFAGMMHKVDESVGRLVEALHDASMLENSIIIFSTDNGGAPEGYEDQSAGSNWPLRGTKSMLFEGGIRGVSFVWSPLISLPARISNGMMHLVDWIPTILDAVGEDPTSTEGGIDGKSQWSMISEGGESTRREMLLNIDDDLGISAVRVDDFKLLNGTIVNGSYDIWWGPSGREGTYNVSTVEESVVGRILTGYSCPLPEESAILSLRGEIDIACDTNEASVPCEPLKEPCLFNVTADPCERRNLAQDYPDLVTDFLERIQEYRNQAEPSRQTDYDPAGNPKYWGYSWTNWQDFPSPISSGWQHS